ncbi:MAG: ribonuclease HII [Treponema sp.]|nr:ribonuclease HII [Treponema sp.]
MLVGLDEAGRGPLAGPVYAAAVILPSDFPPQVLNDSKKLTEKKRDKAAFLIQEQAAYGIASAEASEIDKINILQASLLAMTRAWEALVAAFPGSVQNSNLSAVADGLYCPTLPIPCKALVKADSLVPEVMAASILAKTARDKMMKRFSWFYPEYGYEKHKGYPTKAHLELIAQYGTSPIQRLSFKVKPIQGKLF